MIYVGEPSGATADDRFHEMLESDWEAVETIDVPRWFGMKDWMFVYRRK